MTFGSEADEEMSKLLFNKCRDVGINLFDTANIYGDNRCTCLVLQQRGLENVYNFLTILEICSYD